MRILLLICLIASFHVSAQKQNLSSKPKLVVGIVLDQMRHDLLYRFQERYGQNGFRRLMHEGNSCENALINYLPSYTAPGHACIYTGTVPALHGIASNDWIERQTGAWMYCTQDKSVEAVGGTSRAGKMSPKNLWASTITDELRLSSNFNSKVIAVSVKDRASIIPGGHTSNGTYWMDDSLGEFMTSTYFTNNLPQWVKDFNSRKLAKQYMNKEWNTLFPISSYIQSTDDSNSYEGKFSGESASSFPHLTSRLKLSDIKRTPYGNEILADFAKEAILSEKLGMGSYTDFLSVSFSSTDYIGHMFGPNSIELEDTYLRIDKTIEDLLNFLDEHIGEGDYTIFLTADHGVAHNPQFLIDRKIPSGFFFAKPFKESLNTHLNNVFKIQNLVKDVSENFVWLNDSVLNSTKVNRQVIVNEIVLQARKYPEIHFVVDMENIAIAPIPSTIKEMAINGYVPNRSGDILLLLKPAWLDAYAKTGTTHGTWNPYDTHIPLIWYGWGIKKGITYREVTMCDISATLASLLHIQMPNASIGKPILEVIK